MATSEPTSAAWRYDIKGLRCERDERLLFRDLAFAVAAGDVVQIDGPNGSGKTTLLRILSGLSQQFDGELHWCGEPMSRAALSFRSDLFYLGHAPAVKALLTPLENLQWSMGGETHTREATLAALKEVGLYGYEDVPCFSLSAGQQRRVALARLYLTTARLWILDEPFTAIDKSGVAALEWHISAHAERGGGVILTTHHALQLPGKFRKLNLTGYCHG
jgi:heme exporter protein A